MNGPTQVKVKWDDDGIRIDRWFKNHYPQLSFGALQKMLRKGQVRVDGGRVQASHRIEAGQMIRVPPMPDPSDAPKPRAMSRADARERLAEMTLYEDAGVMVLNKPFGLAVQGGAKTTDHIDALLEAVSPDDARIRLVHRLDRDTGGLLVTAKTRKAAQWLTEAFRGRTIEKEYWALVKGVPQPLEGRIDAKLEKAGPKGQEKARPSDDGQKAITDYQVIEMAAQKASFVALRPITGRTHQLRAHMALIGTPIVGDGKYGGSDAKVDGLPQKMHLFCRRLVIPRPGNRPLVLEAPLHGHMKETWKLFNFDERAKPEWPEDL
ncbi:RluA family pseudouridine synthase [Parvularcula sp. ZS-1/3]|uniref:Pseudouridine synthase n=1 Tax=Parvularcula mediterranea TaxID=2732508 RepID=A0A7Y3RKH9_9PROT|nr:RluA family pseudouridine synthase [Parvularcula mediterranea]NNU15236.1 RluA family pseudouridine synthase [Parvularcula mediterranea]